MSIKKPIYPLDQVLAVKKERVDKARKVVEDKKRALEVELEKLRNVETERDAVLKHHGEKLAQLRKALDEGTTSHEVLKMKSYLKVVKERLVKEEQKVKEQQQHVKLAERNLEEAKKELKKRRVEEEKLTMHKDEWTKEEEREIAKKEAKEHDEVGQVLHESHRRKKKEKE